MKRSTTIILLFATTACTKQETLLPAHDTSTPVRINEVFANGADKDGDAEHGGGDWLELYNAGTAVHFNAGEWFITDDRDVLFKFELPTISLAHQGHLRIWCDAGDGSGIHAPFRLSCKGEWLALVRLNKGRSAIIDSLSYTPQTRKRSSAGRYPDGAERWVKASTPTPGTANVIGLQVEVASVD